MKTTTVTQEMLLIIDRFDNELKSLLTHDLRSKKTREKLLDFMKTKPVLARAV